MVEKKVAKWKWLKVDKNKALQSNQKRFQAIVRVENASKNYENSYSISNIKVIDLKGPSYIKYQDKTLIDCIEEHNGVKIVLQMFACSRIKTTDELMQHKARSRMYILTSKEEIPKKIGQMATEVKLNLIRWRRWGGGW